MQKPLSKNIVKVYHDAIATEALEILELSHSRVLLVTDLCKHQPRKDEEESISNLSGLTVYEVVHPLFRLGSGSYQERVR